MSDELQLIGRIRELSTEMLPEPTGAEARLAPLHGVRAVLFDVYGTLFISGSGDVGTAMASDHSGALVEALAAAGFDVLRSEAGRQGRTRFFDTIKCRHAMRRADGVEFPEIEIREVWGDVLRSLVRDGMISGEVTEARAMRLAVEYECRVNPVWPMPGLTGTLGAIRDADLRLGIVSNAQFFTPLLFNALCGEGPESLGFDPALCCWSYLRLEAKPSPRIFEEVLGELRKDGIAPDAVLYVGNDMRNDMLPALRCGCRTVLFAGDARSLRLREDDPDCRDVRPDAVITELAQLMDCLA